MVQLLFWWSLWSYTGRAFRCADYRPQRTLRRLIVMTLRRELLLIPRMAGELALIGPLGKEGVAALDGRARCVTVFGARA